MGLPSDSGIELWSKWPAGPRDLITDVPGVKVGHVTIQDGEVNTGLTAVLPHGGDLFLDKVMAAQVSLNGFGKSAGLLQIEELGTIETPILMTNTLSVGTALTGLVRYMLEGHPDIGVTTGTVNCVVTECNDGHLNDIRGLHVREEHVRQAIEGASEDFAEGAVGGGTGMCCLGLKGGIGSASRVLKIDGGDYTVGAMVMANFGSAGNLVIGGRHVGREIQRQKEAEKDQGSIILLIATDIPLSERQLKRVARRASISLGLTWSFMGNGSGDIAIAFTTANRVPHYSRTDILPLRMFFDENIDMVFEAAVEAMEEAILSALYHGETTTGVRGNTVRGLRSYQLEEAGR